MDFGDDNPAPSESWSKKADNINIGNGPASVVANRQRRMALVVVVVAASARPDEAFTPATAVTEGINEDVFVDSDFHWRRPMGRETLDTTLSFGAVSDRRRRMQLDGPHREN